MENYTPPNLILYNANVLTMDKKNPKAEAIGIAEDKISFVGQNDEIHTPSTEAIDLKGKTVVPGFIDSHVHFVQMGLQLLELDLRDTHSIKDALSKLSVRVREAEKGKWIIGYGWDETKWKDVRFIAKGDIDKVSPNNPVILKRICMHLWVLNSRAIEVLHSIAALSLQTGHLNVSLQGDVKEILKGYFSPTEDELQNALQQAQMEAIRLGVTSVHEMTPVPAEYRIPESKIRNLKSAAEPVKIFADGSLGARTAALNEDYADNEGNSGTLIWSQQELDDIVAKIHVMGRQAALHAIGDRAIASALDALEKAIKVNPTADHRHRIEHCELVDNKLISRIRDLNIIVSAQPNFVGEWGSRGGLYEQRLGKERWQRMNPLAQFKRKGIPMAFGSDGMPFGPMYGIWSCVNHPVIESRLSPEDAVYYYTYGGAYASFDETKKGTIEVGKLADIVVLSDDITNIPQSDIKDIKVIMTIIGGKVCLDTLGLIRPL